VTRRAVITGVGVTSAFGIGAARLHDGLAAGRSAVGPIRSFDAATFPVQVAGEVPVGVADADWLVTHAPHPMIDAVADGLEELGGLRDRKIAFALAAAAEAWRHAGLSDDGPGAALARDGHLVLGLGLEHASLEDFGPVFDRGGARVDWSREASARLPDLRFRQPLDLAARAVAELLGVHGPIVANVSACAAGALAIAQAAARVERGAALVVTGAADSMVNLLGFAGMARLGAPSPRASVDACRPFDRHRDGLVIGEGAAVFVVEDEAHALARGARPLARILGWGATQDAYRLTAPRPEGEQAARAMTMALARAGLPATAVDYVNAHGTGTPLNDPAECRALRRALGPHAERVAISSQKGAFGHLMAAAGAIEVAAALLAFTRDLLPGTAHLTERDPECDLDIVGPTPRPARADVVLSNSFGFGGQNATLCLGRWS
jgi:3-oxoacyl-[acyl-carrier-protein] synthase II